MEEERLKYSGPARRMEEAEGIILAHTHRYSFSITIVKLFNSYAKEMYKTLGWDAIESMFCLELHSAIEFICTQYVVNMGTSELACGLCSFHVLTTKK